MWWMAKAPRGRGTGSVEHTVHGAAEALAGHVQLGVAGIAGAALQPQRARVVVLSRSANAGHLLPPPIAHPLSLCTGNLKESYIST